MEKLHVSIPVFFLSLFMFLTYLPHHSYSAQQDIILYTPYPSQSVTPGESIDYDIEIINRSGRIENLTLSVLGIPGDWNPKIESGNRAVKKVSVKPESYGEESSREIELAFTIPLEINQGSYDFELLAETESGRQYVLPMEVAVTEQGVFETELEVTQGNMEGYADSEFNYNTTLTNRTATTQNYALVAEAPPGWRVRFRVRGNYATSVTLDSNESENISVNVTSPSRVEADTYAITVRAVSGGTSDEATLETVIIGEHELEVTTPSGILSAEVTAGDETTLPVLVRNTGTVPLSDISLNASPPAEWDVEFDFDGEEDRITQLEPGESKVVNSTVRASEKAIAGDYRLTVNASTSEASSRATFRITVNRSIAGGAVGLFFIVLVIGGVSYMVKKYGRR